MFIIVFINPVIEPYHSQLNPVYILFLLISILLSYHLNVDLQSDFFLMRAKCPSYVIFINLISIMISSEECRLRARSI
jgi:hypothetical protein